MVCLLLLNWPYGKLKDNSTVNCTLWEVVALIKLIHGAADCILKSSTHKEDDL